MASITAAKPQLHPCDCDPWQAAAQESAHSIQPMCLLPGLLAHGKAAAQESAHSIQPMCYLSSAKRSATRAALMLACQGLPLCHAGSCAMQAAVPCRQLCHAAAVPCRQLCHAGSCAMQAAMQAAVPCRQLCHAGSHVPTTACTKGASFTHTYTAYGLQRRACGPQPTANMQQQTMPCLCMLEDMPCGGRRIHGAVTLQPAKKQSTCESPE
eukprot:365707-Chlamydomonas_euryale.AAC.28